MAIYTLATITDKLQKTKDEAALQENLELVETALSQYPSQKNYSDSDRKQWLKLVTLAGKRYTEQAFSDDIKATIKAIKDYDIGQQAVANSNRKGTALGLESLEALLQQKGGKAPSENIPNIEIFYEAQPALQVLETTAAAMPKPIAQEASAELPAEKSPRPAKLPKLDMAHIEQLNDNDFKASRDPMLSVTEQTQARRRANKRSTQACEEYVKQNRLDNENIRQLQSSELTFLYRNLSYSQLEGKGSLLSLIENEMLYRLCTSKENMDGHAWINPRESKAQDAFVRTLARAKNVEKSFLEYCQSTAEALNNYQNPEPEKKRRERVAKSAELLPPLVINEILRQDVTEITPPPAKEGEPEVIPAPPPAKEGKPVVTKLSLAQAFEQACDEKQIKYEKTVAPETKATEYALYSPKAEENAEPTGKLTIAEDNNVMMQSEELQHFVALAQAAKQSGHSSLKVGELSSDPVEAKKFVAMLVLAGHIAKLDVEHDYNLKDLAEVNPEIKKMQDLKKLSAQKGKFWHQLKEAQSQEDKEKARENYAKIEKEWYIYRAEHGDVGESLSKEERYQKINDELSQKATTAKNPQQKQEASKTLAALQQYQAAKQAQK